VFDASTPAAPVLKGTLQMSGRGQRVALLDATAYVADGPVGLRVVDVSAPSKPTIVGTYKTRGPHATSRRRARSYWSPPAMRS
jgi:hypothetical protein